MKAIILAAGRGSRMGALTDTLPKCRTVLHDKELIQWQMDALVGAGIQEIGIVRGYLAETFEFDVHYFDNLRWEKTNMVMSLAMAEEWLTQDTCIVSYSDIVYLKESVAQLMAAQGDICMTYDPNWATLWKMRFDDPLSDAETFKLDGNRVIEIGNRANHLEEIEGQYMGLLRFSPQGWQSVQEFLKTLEEGQQDRLDMTSLLQRLISHESVVTGVPSSNKW